jgi:Transposase, Mutator family
MPRSVTIRSLPRAFDLVKGMQAQGLEWGEGYRGLGREAIAVILGGRMDQVIDEHLARMSALDQTDRRNCPYRRHLLTELGEIKLAVPRTRAAAPIAVVRASRPHPACAIPRPATTLNISRLWMRTRLVAKADHPDGSAGASDDCCSAGRTWRRRSASSLTTRARSG